MRFSSSTYIWYHKSNTSLTKVPLRVRSEGAAPGSLLQGNNTKERRRHTHTHNSDLVRGTSLTGCSTCTRPGRTRAAASSTSLVDTGSLEQDALDDLVVPVVVALNVAGERAVPVGHGGERLEAGKRGDT